MNDQSTLTFRWFSPLGFSVALFLGYGALNVLVGLVIPFLSRRTGTAGFSTQPALDLTTMLWLAFGIFQLGVAWFGLREKQAWALWVLTLACLAQLIGWVAYGAQTRDWGAPLFLCVAIIIIPATVLGWIGIR
jgi:hypothetical protein